MMKMNKGSHLQISFHVKVYANVYFYMYTRWYALRNTQLYMMSLKWERKERRALMQEVTNLISMHVHNKPSSYAIGYMMKMEMKKERKIVLRNCFLSVPIWKFIMQFSKAFLQFVSCYGKCIYESWLFPITQCTLWNGGTQFIIKNSRKKFK